MLAHQHHVIYSIKTCLSKKKILCSEHSEGYLLHQGLHLSSKFLTEESLIAKHQFQAETHFSFSCSSCDYVALSKAVQFVASFTICLTEEFFDSLFELLTIIRPSLSFSVVTCAKLILSFCLPALHHVISLYIPVCQN